MINKLKKSHLYQKHKLKISSANETLSLVSAFLLLFFVTADQNYQAHERRFMISEIQMTALVTGLHTGLYKVDEKVLNSMARIPRSDFVHTKYAHYAYKNVALPMIDKKHIIPEPFLTAMMIHLMGVNEKDNVLEIGHGTGYEAAILSNLARHVYSIRQEDPLKLKENNINDLEDFDNVTLKHGNGIFGWKDKGPFDAILVKQAVEEPPKKLLSQLKTYGRLVVPIEDETGEQRVYVYFKMPDGSLQSRETLYVKMTRLLPGEDI